MTYRTLNVVLCCLILGLITACCMPQEPKNGWYGFIPPDTKYATKCVRHEDSFERVCRSFINGTAYCYFQNKVGLIPIDCEHFWPSWNRHGYGRPIGSREVCVGGRCSKEYYDECGYQVNTSTMVWKPIR